MNRLGITASLGTPTVSLGAPAGTPDPALVTPGILGFLVFFSLALATWALLRSLNRRLRNVRFEERDPDDDRTRRRRDEPGGS